MAGRLATLWSWLRASPPRLALVSAAFAAGSLAGLPAGEQLYRYQWADDRFCDDCHVHDYANEALHASVHNAVTTCHDCHRVPIRHYPHNLWRMLTDRPTGPEDIGQPTVATVVCEQCHTAEGASEPLSGPLSALARRAVVKIDQSPLHRAHLDAKTRDPGIYRGGEAEAVAEPGAIGCVDCHGEEEHKAHLFTADTASCLHCHEEQGHLGGRAAKLQCRDCHYGGFLGEPGGLAAKP